MLVTMNFWAQLSLWQLLSLFQKSIQAYQYGGTPLPIGPLSPPCWWGGPVSLPLSTKSWIIHIHFNHISCKIETHCFFVVEKLCVFSLFLGRVLRIINESGIFRKLQPPTKFLYFKLCNFCLIFLPHTRNYSKMLSRFFTLALSVMHNAHHSTIHV